MQEHEKLYQAAKQLNPFSTKFRYPTEYGLLDRADTELAVRNAAIVMKFVLKKIARPDVEQTTIFKREI